MSQGVSSTLPKIHVALELTTTWRLTRAMSLGDAEAIQWFYDQFFDFMLAEAQRCSGRDESFCLDVVQDATLKAIHCVRPIDSHQHLQRWVRVLVRSVVYDQFRQEHRRRQRERDRSSRLITERDPDELQWQSRLAWLEEQLERLDGGSRKLLRLRYRFGWTLARIAKVLGIKTGAVDGRIQRLVQRIRQNAEIDFDDQ